MKKEIMQIHTSSQKSLGPSTCYSIEACIFENNMAGCGMKACKGRVSEERTMSMYI